VSSFEKETLADLVDPTLAAVRLTDPPWTKFYGEDGLAAHVASVIHEGAAHARETAEGEEECVYGEGGIRITFDPVGGTTSVYVLMGYVHDPDPSPSDDDAVAPHAESV
jgi:hypothetical protein